MLDQNVRLRAASTTDAPALSALGARLFEQTFGVHNTPEDMQSYLAESFAPERQAAELAEPNRRTWIAEDTAGVAVGYAVLIRGEASQFVDGNRPAELRRIYVDRSLHGRPADDQGRGASVILLEQCLAQARDWGCDVIWLAVWENNPRAMRFYEKNGFRVVGKTLFRLGGDIQHDFVMARNL
jgi:ribosomal protein S18 acetylase RimI-like enzyme